MNQVTASDDYASAIQAILGILAAQKIDYAFVGSIALSAWLGRHIDAGPIDVLIVVSPERSRTVPMMAQNRGFRVSREEVEATEELDLIPMYFPIASGEIRIHVLFASNALYGQMVRAALETPFGEGTIRVVSPEDLALLLTLAEEDDALALRERLVAEAGTMFDVSRFNERLTSIGLAERTL